MAAGGRFDVCDVRLEVMHTPGHTPGSVSLYCEDLEVVFTGDTLAASGPVPHKGEFPDFARQLTAIGERLLDLPPRPGCCPATARRRRSATPPSGSTAGCGPPGESVAYRPWSSSVSRGCRGGLFVHADPVRDVARLPAPLRFRYLARRAPPKGPPWAHNSLGASVHNALRGLVAAAAAAPHGAGRGRTRDVRLDLRGILKRGAVGPLPRLGQGPGGGGTPAASTRPTSRSASSARWRRGPTRSRCPGGSTASTPGPRADGADGTELVVVDYKTGRHLLSVDDARSSLALAIYALAASRSLHRDCRRVELHHLPSGQVLAWEHTGESRCSGTCGGPRTSPRSAPRRTSGCAHRCQGRSTTRCSRRGRAPAAAGATTGAAARKGRLPPPRTAPGTR